MDSVGLIFSNPYFLLLFIASCSLAYRFSHQLATRSVLRRKAAAHGCKPVNGTGNRDPFFGIDFLLDRTRNVKQHTWLEFTCERFTKRGLNTCELNILGSKILFTTEPENLKAIHQTNFKSWGITPNRRNRVVPFIGKGIFTNDGHEWQHSRKLLRPSFDRSQLDILDFLERHTKDLVSSIPKDGSTVDLRTLFHRFSMNVATDFLLGDSSGAGFTFGTEFEEAFDRCMSKVGGAGKMMTLGPSEDPQYQRDIKFVHGRLKAFPSIHSKFYVPIQNRQQANSLLESVESRIEQVLSHFLDKPSTSVDRHIFIQHLVSETHDRTQIRSELLNNLMAGRDTTASMLTNAWFEISKHPEIWTRLREEVAQFSGSVPTYSQLQNMPYLRAIFNESMRLYPQLPENGRVALEDTVLPLGGGSDGKSPAFVPKGKVLVWGTYALHRREDIFGENAGVFNPDRWLDTPERKAVKPGWGYLAFGGGSRACIGQQFALIQASYISTRLIQTFSSIESRDPNPWIEDLALVCNNLGGCKIAFRD